MNTIENDQKERVLWILNIRAMIIGKEDNTSALPESLFFDTPCGNLLVWKISGMNPEDSKDHEIPLKKDFQTNEIKSFIADGQQKNSRDNPRLDFAAVNWDRYRFSRHKGTELKLKRITDGLTAED